VVALGADLDPAATPGLIEGGHEFYTEAGAFALRDVIERFDGGRVIVGVTSTPFKCPPAPSETALMMHDHLVGKGIRDRCEIALVMPLPVPIPPSPAASEALLAAFAERGIEFHAQLMVRELDPARNVAVFVGGHEMAYDLFLGVPVHRAPAPVQTSGLAPNGWIGVDKSTLATEFPDVYAVGESMLHHWDGTSWTQAPPAPGPSPRWRHAMCFDDVNGAIVLFGGFVPPAVTGYPMHRNLTGGAEACGSFNRCDHCLAAMRAISVDEVHAAAVQELGGRRDEPVRAQSPAA